jgi:Core-2/I-Branching enzyme
LANASWTGLTANTFHRREPHPLGENMIQHTTGLETANTMLQGSFKRATPQLKEISIAYLILVHRFPEQFKRLFRAIYHPNNHYLISVDQKSGLDFFKNIASFLSDFPNTHIIESGKVVWGGYSMVQSELDGMNYLLKLSTRQKTNER